MKSFYPIFALLLFLFSSCTSNELPPSVETIPNPKIITFKSPPLQNARLGLQAILLGNIETGAMEVKFNLTNYLEAPMQVKYLEAQLATKGGARATPVYSETQPKEVEAGETASYSIQYQSPIHSKHFFHLIEYRGDLNEEYTLNLDFLGFPKQKLVFKPAQTAYEQYLNDSGKERHIKLYEITNHAEWEKGNTECFKSKVPKAQTHAVSWRNGEWNIGGLVGRTSIYQIKESLYFSLRIANQSAMNMSIQPEKLMVEDGNGNILRPINQQIVLTTRKHPKGQGYVVQKSERFQVDYVFSGNQTQKLIVKDLGIRKLPEQVSIPCFSFHSAQSGTGVLESNNSSM